MSRALLALLLAAACGGDEATLRLTLVFPPGADRLPAEATTVRLTLSDPDEVVEGPVAADGTFEVVLETSSLGGSGDLTLEALDAAGVVVARGRTPVLPVALIDGVLDIYVGRPRAFTEAPWSFDAPRDDVAAVAQDYGFIVAGGVDETGARTAEVFAYSAYVHEASAGLDLPEPRSGVTSVAGTLGFVYFFGGLGVGDVPTSAFVAFDTTVSPSGEYTDLVSDPTLARANAPSAPIDADRWVVAGDPVVLLDPEQERAVALETAPAEVRAATALATTEDDTGAAVVVFFAIGAVTLYHPGTDTFDAPIPHAGLAAAPHDALTLPDGDVVAFTIDGAVRVTAAGQIADVPFEDTGGAAIAVVEDLLVVAGGTGDPTTARLHDAETLDLIETTPLVAPRAGATFVLLPNRSLALLGGGVATVEFFTP